MHNTPPETRKTISPAGALVAALVGLIGTLIILSIYRIEEHAFSALLGPIGQTALIPGLGYTLAQGLAAGLSGAKLTLPFIIVQQTALGGGYALRTRTLRLLVIGLALMMALVIFGGATISPNTQLRVNQRIAEITADHDTKAADLTTRHDTETRRISDQMAREISTVTTTAETRLKDLQTQLDDERLIGGPNFKGPRYIELESLIDAEIKTRDQRIADLQTADQNKLGLLATTKTTEMAALDTARDTAIAGIDRAAIAASVEAQNPAIMTTLAIAKKLLPETLADPVLITLALSFAITLVFELLPMTLLAYAYSVFTLKDEEAVAATPAVQAAPAITQRAEVHGVTRPYQVTPPEPANTIDPPAEPGNIA